MNTPNSPAVTDFQSLLSHARKCSRYLQRLLDSDAQWNPWLAENYRSPCHAEEIRGWLDTLPGNDEAAVASALRLLRKRVMLKLVLRDLGGLASLEEVMTAISALAEITVNKARECATQMLAELHGTPTGADSGQPQELLVIGMGKLGGYELNVSSDIDLIFIYPEDGETAGPRNIGNAEFFTRVGRKIISLLNESTADGYVFRVDMRLRPYGDSGALVMSFAALEEYLISQGREWERYAWIKGRVISASSEANIRELGKLVQPFVFRKYMDFGAFDSMRKLHAQIRQEVMRRDRLNNIKLGPGGIREIEFIAQVYQLIRGGREARLRLRATRRVLQLLVEFNQLTEDSAARLDAAYVFLRNLEHRLQYLDDQQTQELPDKQEDQTIIAAAMGYPDYHALLAELDRHRQVVSTHFERIFSTQEKAESAESPIWREGVLQEELQDNLATRGYAEAGSQANRLLQIRDSGRYRQLPELSRQRLDRIIPALIEQCAGTANPDQTLPRVLNLLENISRRASYLAFLAEYPQVLPRLVDIASASEWAADYLSSHPFLLDELLAAGDIYRAPDWQALNEGLDRQLAEYADDMERAMNTLREFHHTQTFRLLAMDIRGLLPLEKLSDHLSDLADLILAQVLQVCWQEARKKHREEPQFAIIAYGKLGGKELGYASDLDLIFLYDDDHPDAAEIYARLAQRINTVLSSYTSAGRLYETDLRLRPNGASGLLVSSIEAFEDYQLKHAWVWEHQALTRARFSAGNRQAGEKFEAIRKLVLCQPRPILELRKEVVAMRQKMHDGHPNPTQLFDIKQDSGGMVDIEFIVQFIVLAYAASHAELTANIGNLALLRRAAELQLIDGTLAASVQEIYRTLRLLQHKHRLNSEGPCRIAPNALDVTPVISLWKKLFPLAQA